MKKVSFFIFLILTSIMISCSSKDEFDPIEKGLVEVDLVNSEMLRLWNGTACSFEAIEDGEYDIKSGNPSVATVKVEGKVFTVKAGKPGQTNITITDKAGNETIIECYSRAFDNYWAEEVDLHKLYQNSINVACYDRSIADIIKADLKEKSADNRDYYRYKFTYDTDELLVVIPTESIPIQGSYNWDFDSRTLTLIYDGVTEKYSCDIMPQYPNLLINLPVPRFILAITMDYTEEYKQKYPNAGIEEVFVIRHLISRADYWCTDRITD